MGNMCKPKCHFRTVLKLYLTLFVAVISVLLQNVNQVQATRDSRGNSCTTPKSQPGECIPLTSCKDLFQLLKRRPVNPTDILYLQQSTCDVNGAQPRVCCPGVNDDGDGGVKVTPKPNEDTSKTPRPPPTTFDLTDSEMSSHKNYNLLPNVTACGSSVLTDPAGDRIIGGQNAGLGAYPFLALLGFAGGEGDDEPIQYACGGTLISSRYVLTAAHCVTNLPYGYKLKTVRLGEYDQTKTTDCEKTESGKQICAPPVQDMEIEEIIPHQEYDKQKSRENDIALLRLKTHAALGPFVYPICIPHGEKLQRSSTDNKVFVAGWGRLAYDSPENAPILQVVKLRLVSMDDCNRVYAHKENFGEHLDDGRFCAGGEEGMDSCKGDSGGPLMMPLRPKSLDNAVRIFQLGVVSLGPSRCGHAGQPALYTKISQYLKWVFDNIRK